MQRSSKDEFRSGRVPHTVPYRIGPRTIITHAHRAPLIDGLGRPRIVVRDLGTSHRLGCVIVRAALYLDTYPHRNLIRPRCAERAKPGRGKPVLIMHIGFLACFHAISLERGRFSEIATFFCSCSTEAVGIAHKPPRSL